jgi:hypothetical protein
MAPTPPLHTHEPPLVLLPRPLFHPFCRRGPTLRECVLLHAVSRLVLHPHITNIQASWVKMGPQQAGRLLAVGCNDMGGSIMNESITRAAGVCGCVCPYRGLGAECDFGGGVWGGGCTARLAWYGAVAVLLMCV